jgi:hypothetical protein
MTSSRVARTLMVLMASLIILSLVWTTVTMR